MQTCQSLLLSLPGVLAACVPTSAEPQSVVPRSGAVQERRAAPRSLGVRTVVVDNPHQRPGSTFGHSVTALDFDGDGLADLGVGADRRGAVYVLLGRESAQARGAFEEFKVFAAEGLVTDVPKMVSDQFGFDVAAGQLDDDPADELVIGAPSLDVDGVLSSGGVFVVGLGPVSSSVTQLAVDGAVSRLGNSVAVGDFDGDGRQDVAAGAPQTIVRSVAAGAVLVWHGPLDASQPRSVRIENPARVANGNFGHVVVSNDVDVSTPGQELFVSSLGNTSQGVAFAGEIYQFPAPLDPETFIVTRDTRASEGDPSRFGMDISASRGQLAVGAPRKDWQGVVDSGLAFGFTAPTWQEPRFFSHPTPRRSDVHGFRVLVADLVGDSAVDLGVGSLPVSGPPPANGLWFWVWPGADPSATPLRFDALRDAGDHWIQGLAAGDFVPGGRLELVTGDPTWDRPGQTELDNVGRVVIYVVQE